MWDSFSTIVLVKDRCHAHYILRADSKHCSKFCKKRSRLLPEMIKYQMFIDYH
jgi:hypothetical protein